MYKLENPINCAIFMALCFIGGLNLMWIMDAKNSHKRNGYRVYSI